ncbi:MAG TPA: acetyl-CoA carboxylase biotin carboxyl carrier protein, partial [bacterium]|nr:acetyl-CoA carboxylase biotin carboxyl carrier protein [bacterium]
MSDEAPFDLEQIRAVIRLAAEADIAELEVESPALRVLVKKAGATHVAASAPAAAAPHPVPAVPASPGAAPPAPGADNHLAPVTAPMVGTFYRAASPDAPPFVSEGDIVEAGQTVCIIEAMKLFNEIQSDV